MSTARKIGILLIIGGLLLPVIGLGFVSGYNPNLGFVGSIPRMRIVYKSYEYIPDKSIPYGVVFALGCVLVGVGTGFVIFKKE